MSFTPLVALGTLVFTFVNFLKACSAVIQTRPMTRELWSPVVTQIIAWLAGIGGVLIAAHTQFASAIKFGDQQLSDMNTWTLVFIGLIATSLLGTVNELKKAIDSSDSARKPNLLTGKTSPPPDRGPNV